MRDSREQLAKVPELMGEGSSSSCSLSWLSLGSFSRLWRGGTDFRQSERNGLLLQFRSGPSPSVSGF